MSHTLSAPNLAGIRKVIRRQSETGVTAEAVTLEGFLHFVLSIIEKRKVRNGCLCATGALLRSFLLACAQADVVWAMLRKFGYGDDVTLHLDIPSS